MSSKLDYYKQYDSEGRPPFNNEEYQLHYS